MLLGIIIGSIGTVIVWLILGAAGVYMMPTNMQEQRKVPRWIPLRLYYWWNR